MVGIKHRPLFIPLSVRSSADVQFVGFLSVVVGEPDEFIPLDVVLKTVKEGSLEIGLQRESEFSSQDLAFKVHDDDFI